MSSGSLPTAAKSTASRPRWLGSWTGGACLGGRGLAGHVPMRGPPGLGRGAFGTNLDGTWYGALAGREPPRPDCGVGVLRGVVRLVGGGSEGG